MDAIRFHSGPIGFGTGGLRPSLTGPGGGEGFGAAMLQAVERINQLQLGSAAEIREWLTGESEDLHRTLLSVQKADLAFTMLLEARNKVVQAYQEIMRMQV